MKKDEIEYFSKTYAQLEALHNEISLLSKKSPSDGVNKFKLKLVNIVLTTTNEILGQKNKPFEDFSVFDEDDLPNNGDVNMLLSQYLSCMEELRVSNIQHFIDRWYWTIDGARSKIITFSPRK